MIRFNLPGLVMVFFCGAMWGALGAFGLAENTAAYVMLAVMFVFDVVYRLRHEETGVWKWLGSHAGGFVGIAPVWLVAVVLAAMLTGGYL